jgi:hypothetical protein
MTRQDKARQDKTRQDKTRQDKTRQDKTRQDKTRRKWRTFALSSVADLIIWTIRLLTESKTTEKDLGENKPKPKPKTKT